MGKTEPIPIEHWIAVAEMTGDIAEIACSVAPETRARLARFLDLESLDRLDVTGRVTRRADRVSYEVALAVSADVTQTCVVSLEPVSGHVDETMTLVYTPNPEFTDQVGAEVKIDVFSEDPPEPLVGGRIDIGSLVVELMALGIDPYPRKPGAELPAGGAAEGTAEGPGGHPFAALARLKRES